MLILATVAVLVWAMSLLFLILTCRNLSVFLLAVNLLLEVYEVARYTFVLRVSVTQR